MPVDFSKLSDPVYRAKAREEREAKEAIAQEKDNRIRTALKTCEANSSEMTVKEREFIKSCDRHTRVHFRDLSDKQEKWLFDIETRLNKSKSLEVQSVIGKPRLPRLE